MSRSHPQDDDGDDGQDDAQGRHDQRPRARRSAAAAFLEPLHCGQIILPLFPNRDI